MRRYALLLVAALAALPAVIRSRPSGTAAPGPAAFDVLTSSHGFVRVSGEVRRPGLYPLSANMMASGVINVAGALPPLSSAEAERLSRRPLTAGEALHVAATAAGDRRVTVAAMSVRDCIAMGIPLDPARLSVEEWDLLPGIGPGAARRIVEFRQKNGGKLRPDDLIKVEGVGEKRLAQLNKYFK